MTTELFDVHRIHPLVLRLGLLFLVPAWTCPASAQDADALLREGIAERRRGDDEAALALFRRAHEVAPSGRTLAQMGFAEQALGLWVEAYEHLSAARDEGGAWVERQRAVIEEALDTVRARVGFIEVRSDLDEAEVEVNGVVRTLPLREPLAVVAGEVTLVVRAPAHRPLTRTVRVVAGQLTRETVRPVPEVDSTPSEPALEPVAGVVPERGRANPPASTGSDGLTIGGATAMAGGALVLGLGLAAFGVREVNAATFNDDAQCFATPGVSRADQCPDALSVVQTAELLGGLGVGLGGALAVVGVVLVAVGATAGGESASAFSCGGGPGDLGLACGGRF